MKTPTLDHSLTPRRGECLCADGVWCPRCYRDLQRFRAEQDLAIWLRAFGTLPDPGAPKR